MTPPKKTYVLKLYVAGNTANSVRALKTLNNILEEEFQGVYALKVIDVLKILSSRKRIRFSQPPP
jgi:circadian clock protein KaiB